MIVHAGKQTYGQAAGIEFPGTNDLKQKQGDHHE